MNEQGERQALIEGLIEQVNSLMSHRRRAFCRKPLFREVSLPQIHVLVFLHEGGTMTVSELAHLLDISAPSASAIVDRMEEHGLVDRERAAADRRVVHVHITEHGRSVAEEMVGMKRDSMLRLLQGMTDDELRDVSAGIVALNSAVNRLASGDQGTRTAS